MAENGKRTWESLRDGARGNLISAKFNCMLYFENFIQNDKMIKYLFDQDIVITVKFFNNSSTLEKYYSSYQRYDNEIKQIRAQGGCLGTKSRRKTW